MDPLVPKNLTARLTYRGRGNPPASHPSDAIGNCFPGLELDIRALLRNLFVGIVLHEATGIVLAVDPTGPAAGAGLTGKHLLYAIDATSIRGENFNAGDITLDWSNVLADFVQGAGRQVTCTFVSLADGAELAVPLEIRTLLVGAALAPDVAAAGELTQSLCSPWQSDFRECSCDYWAANRPDFSTVEIVDNAPQGFNWLQKDRSPEMAREYIADPRGDNPPEPRLASYEDLYRDWERLLRFQIGGADEPAGGSQRNQDGGDPRPPMPAAD